MTSRRPIAWHRARVVAVRPETDTARRIVLDVPTWPGNDAGSHLDIRLTAPDGYQATRSYSIGSSGEGGRILLAVDLVEDGEVSPFLVHTLAAGDEIEVHGPLGRFFLWMPPTDPAPTPVQLIAGGSGVVPLFAMAAAHERSGDTGEFRLLYSVRGPGDVFFRDELAGLSRTRVDTLFTRVATATRNAGRITRDELAELTVDAAARSSVYVCGPTPFVETIANWLLELGHDAAAVRTERFGGS